MARKSKIIEVSSNMEKQVRTLSSAERLGKIEATFVGMAAERGISPRELLQKIVDAGVTQQALADHLECTRPGISVLSKRYGVAFPGRRIPLKDAVADVADGLSFGEYVTQRKSSGLSNSKIAKELRISLSTLKRRLKELDDDDGNN